MGFFDSIKSGFKYVGNKVAGFAKSAAPVVWNFAKQAEKKVEGAVSTVYNDAVGMFKRQQEGIFGLANKAVDKGASIIEKGEDTIGGIASSLAMPLVIGGVAVVAILLFKK